jgi:hypothetical protein
MLAMKWVLQRCMGSGARRSQGPLRARHVTSMPIFIPMALLLAGCAQDRGESLNLPVACETAVCDCASDSGFTAKPPPLQWKTDGTAYCREGFHLHMPPPPSQRMTVQ